MLWTSRTDRAARSSASRLRSSPKNNRRRSSHAVVLGAQHAAPLRALSGYTTRIVNPTLPARPPLPGLRLPLGRRRLGPGATLAVFVHAVIVGVLVVGGREVVGQGQGESRAGGGDARVNFFAIPAGAPAAVDMALPARLTPSELSALRRIHVELPAFALPQATLPAPTAALGGGGGNAGGGAGGRGTGLGAASGAGVGPGTGDEAGYIFPAAPRRANVPSLGKVPGSVAGHTYRVKFWVSAEGRDPRGGRPTDRRCGVRPGVPAAHDGVPVLPGPHPGRAERSERRHDPNSNRSLARRWRGRQGATTYYADGSRPRAFCPRPGRRLGPAGLRAPARQRHRRHAEDLRRDPGRRGSLSATPVSHHRHAEHRAGRRDLRVVRVLPQTTRRRAGRRNARAR